MQTYLKSIHIVNILEPYHMIMESQIRNAKQVSRLVAATVTVVFGANVGVSVFVSIEAIEVDQNADDRFGVTTK